MEYFSLDLVGVSRTTIFGSVKAVSIPPVKRVAIIGPECTGKSVLSSQLASHFQTAWAAEYARGYIDNLVRPYTQTDLITIAHGQLRLEDQNAMRANKVLFCDTNLYVIKVWSNFRFGEVAPEIQQLIQTRHYDLYLLTYIDIPWQEDPQREHPHQREQLYNIYLNEMRNQSVPFVEIRGSGDDRKNSAVAAVSKLLTTA
jgi:NadR type nicotinamide-nucleotide adenylyltransferase